MSYATNENNLQADVFQREAAQRRRIHNYVHNGQVACASLVTKCPHVSIFGWLNAQMGRTKVLLCRDIKRLYVSKMGTRY